jgi:hypothetical protein
MFWLTWQLVGVAVAIVGVVVCLWLGWKAIKTAESVAGFVFDRLHWILGIALLLVLLWLLAWWK